jgi:hypothetical protein
MQAQTYNLLHLEASTPTITSDRRRFLEIDHLELPMAAMFVKESGRNEQLLENHPYMLPTKFRFI